MHDNFSPPRSAVLQWFSLRVDWLGFGILTLLALVIFARQDVLHAPIGHDMTLQMYAAQLISEGLAPYTNVGLVKTPLAAFYGALAILVGNLFGMWDILAVRFAFWMAMALGAGGIYLWVREQFDSRLAGIVAALAFLGLDVIGRNAVLGPQPKILVVAATIFCFLFLRRAQWFRAGLCAALAFLAWQPAGILMPIAFAAVLLDPLRNRVREALVVSFGMAAPLTLVTLFLLWHNALGAALQDTFGANLSYVQNSSAQAGLRERIADNLAKIFVRRGRNCYGNPIGMTWSIVGLIGIIGVEIFTRRHAWRALLSRAYFPLLSYSIFFLAFSSFDYQVCDDLIPLAPLYAFGAGGVVYAAMRAFQHWRGAPSSNGAHVLGIALVGIFAAQMFLGLPPMPQRALSLEKQAATAAQFAPYLEPGDEIQQLGDAALLVFLHRRNTTKLIFFGPKTGNAVLQQIPGGIDTILAQLDARPPRLVALSHVRPAASPWYPTLRKWIDDKYDAVGVYEMFTGRSPNLQVFVRKPTAE